MALPLEGKVALITGSSRRAFFAFLPLAIMENRTSFCWCQGKGTAHRGPPCAGNGLPSYEAAGRGAVTVAGGFHVSARRCGPATRTAGSVPPVAAECDKRNVVRSATVGRWGRNRPDGVL